jgi:putative ABC transport system permease protein
MKRGRRALDGLEDEIRDHVERETQDNIDRGIAPEEARRLALVRFGNVALAGEDARAEWGWAPLDHLLQDARYAARALRRRPAYALLCVLTLALAVGGTASVFGVARGVLFEPLPYANERDLGVFWKKTDWNHEEYLYIRGRVPGFAEVALYRRAEMLLRHGDGRARLVPAVSASAELFETLGAAPLLGRGFSPGDDVPHADPVAVLSHGLWEELGGRPSIIGSRLTLDGTARTVVGVMPRGFWFPDPSVRVFTPWPLSPESRSWNSTLVGRVAAGEDVRAMEAQVARLTAMLAERFDYPAQWDKTKDARITPLRDDLLGPMRPTLLTTVGAMALILLIACANVGALVLGQVDERAADFAIRSALGANRRRLARQLVVEVLLVAAAAGMLGALLARAAFAVVTRALPLGEWRDVAAPDWRVFAAAMTIAVAAALVVALVPVVSLCRRDLRSVMSRVRTGGVGERGGRLEGGLVIAQVALAVTVAAGAGLLARSVANLYAVDAGVPTEGLAAVDVLFDRDGRDRARVEQTLDELVTALSALPGVQSVGAAQQLPLRGGGYRLDMSSDQVPQTVSMATTEYRVVTPGYLESVGLPLHLGRSIDRADRASAERVVVINEALAGRYFAGVDPVGRLVRDANGTSRVVGVVGNAVETRLRDPAPPVRYVPVAQAPWLDPEQSLVLRLAPGVDERSVLEAARRTIASVAPDVVVRETTRMREVLDAAVGPARDIVLLLGLLTALALVLGAVGIYGATAHFAARRRRDWAVRVALGLPGARVVLQIVARSALLVAAGVAVGVAGAALLTRALSPLLYGVAAFDPVAFAAAAAALLGVGVAAASRPAWQAGTADPLPALREQ